ncbi:MAG: hypothetical protein RL653_403, partial [Pseudomonadota bacterium]
ICGFKSFMERTVITFGDGVTGVVGPNGCGKSNVVDSIRWVMGEQSAKNLRGRGMEDVIFNGSEKNEPLNMAEVSLTFRIEETDQLAPQYAGFSEVTVTRRLFRSGESEYLINKVPCRLLDITELFLGTGVGTRAYSIIEQGRVGLIVSSKPEDRRSLIEEAAGISKYKSRRKAAERKMEATEGNLVRVTDVVNELEKRLEGLQRQAKKAEKYKRLRGEMRELELHHASHRYMELQGQAADVASRLQSSTGDEQSGMAEVQGLEADISARRAQLELDAHELQSRADRLHAEDAQAQLDARNLEHWRSDLEATQKRLAEATEEKAQLERRMEELSLRAAGTEGELTGASGNWEDDAKAADVAQEALKSVAHQQSELGLKLEMERAALMSIASRMANHESNLTSLARQKADLLARADRARAEAETLRSRLQELEDARADVARRVNEGRQLALELAERRTVEEETLERTRSEFAENEVHVISLREALADKRSRHEQLEAFQKSYEGYDRGVRAVMTHAGEQARERGIFGLVSDVVTVEPRYERALEAALGERLQAVLVESRAQGLELIEFLKSTGEGRGTFLAVEAVKDPGELNRPDLDRAGVVAWALSEVTFDPALGPAVRALLADVVITEDLRAARECQALSPGWTWVTLEGEVLRPDGSLTGGTLEGAAVGALHKKREIAELQEELKGMEERYNEILTRHYALQKQMQLAEGVLKGLEKNRHSEELRVATDEKDLHRAGEELSRARERLGTLDAELGEQDAQLAALATEEETSRGEVAHGQADREQREERLRQMTAELEALKLRHEGLSAEVTSLRVKAAAGSERGEAARKELESARAQLAEVQSRLERATTTVAESSARVEELSARILEGEERLANAPSLDGARAELEAARADWEARNAEVKALETTLRDTRARVEGLMQGLGELQVRGKELELECAHLVEQMRDRHQLELPEQLDAWKDKEPLGPEALDTLRELRGQLERMGEVNLTALDEHAELSGRFEFLQKQKTDLEQSLERLRDAIAKIDKTSRERFKETFDIVNEKFQAVFPRLFKGGRAGLILTDEGPGMEPGVEIVAQPPGKKLQSVNLLSGGEKALTAVALIFAIFLIKPTPFCLLDEVDAPLDEGNVGRYNDMVKEMSAGSQFILITHNKRTMEIADTLYGVTMEEPGCSKLVSVNMKEAAAANEDTQVA